MTYHCIIKKVYLTGIVKGTRIEGYHDIYIYILAKRRIYKTVFRLVISLAKKPMSYQAY